MDSQDGRLNDVLVALLMAISISMLPVWYTFTQHISPKPKDHPDQMITICLAVELLVVAYLSTGLHLGSGAVELLPPSSWDDIMTVYLALRAVIMLLAVGWRKQWAKCCPVSHCTDLWRSLGCAWAVIVTGWMLGCVAKRFLYAEKMWAWQLFAVNASTYVGFAALCFVLLQVCCELVLELDEDEELGAVILLEIQDELATYQPLIRYGGRRIEWLVVRLCR